MIDCCEQESFSPENKSPVSSVSLGLNPCSIDLDPGLVDRTYILLNYAEMDPDCLKVARSRVEIKIIRYFSTKKMQPKLSLVKKELPVYYYC